MKYVQELKALAFTLLASTITIMTLSGSLQTWALWLTAGALILHLSGVADGNKE